MGEKINLIIIALYVVSLVCIPRYVLCFIELSHVSTIYLPYDVTPNNEPRFDIDSGSVEQMAYHEGDKLLYVVGDGIYHVVNCSNPNNLTRILSIKMPNQDLTDIEVCGDYIYMTADNKKDREDGKLLVLNKYSSNSSESFKVIHSVTVGVVPDMIQLTEDCKTALIAVEGEPYKNDIGFIDPPGAVVILHFLDSNPKGSKPIVKKLDFKKFENRHVELKTSGVRFSNLNNSRLLTDEFEPEYITLDREGKKAFVVLQENNAVAEIDLEEDVITEVYGLGYKQWGNFDASDADGGISITFWPIRAFYQPDGIKFYKWQGKKLAFTANEGEARKYSSIQFDERKIGSSFVDSKLGKEVPAWIKSALNDTRKLGNLLFSGSDGLSDDGVYQSLYTFGARSFSIWDTDDSFRLLYDSGSDVEEKIAQYCPHLFNSDGAGMDSRSDNQGPQPEAIIVEELGERLYIFVAAERPGILFVYSLGSDIVSPQFETIFCDGVPNDQRSMKKKFEDGHLYMVDPEDIKYIGPGKLSKHPLLFVSGSKSSSVSILKIKTDALTVHTRDSNMEMTDSSHVVHHSSLLLFVAFIVFILN